MYYTWNLFHIRNLQQPKVLTNIHKEHIILTLQCNYGSISPNEVGNLSIHGYVWVHEHIVANTMSLSQVKYKLMVTYDIKKVSIFIVHMPTNKLYFHQSRPVISYYDNINYDVTLVSFIEEN